MGEQLIVVDKRDGARQPRQIGQVAHRLRWWGTDADVTRKVEAIIGNVESDVTPLLRNPVAHWPPSRDERLALSQFIAIHCVRSPAWRRWTDGTSYEVVAETIKKAPELAPQAAAMVQSLLNDVPRVQLQLRQIPRIASLAASMHWTLIEFDDRLLLTGDQPVCPLPFGVEQRPTAITLVPRTGFVRTLEWRLALTPRHALVMSWLDAPDGDPVVQGAFEQASNLNASAATQADTQWFHHPRRVPVQIVAPAMEPSCGPLSVTLFPGYDTAAAERSQRFRKAHDIIVELQGEETNDTIKWVTVTSNRRAA